MKPATLRKSLWLLMCGSAVVAQGALRPEGDKIEFSPPREDLKVAPLTGSDLESPKFNFQNREPGGSVSDVPAAVALPAPDQVNRMRALQELIERRSAWARPEGVRDDLGDDLTGVVRGSETELGIDDLFDRRTGRMDRGLNPYGETDSRTSERGIEGDTDRSALDRRAMSLREARERGLSPNRDRATDPLSNPDALAETDNEASDFLPGQRSGVDDGTRDGRRQNSDGFLEFGSLIPRSTDHFIGDSVRNAPTRDDRMDSLRRILGNSAPNILGTSGSRPATGAGSLFGVPSPGSLGAVPGANRNLSQSLDSRLGASVPGPAMEDRPGSDRLTSAPNRPFELDLTTGREGFSSRSERLQAAPPPTPMEMFRKKHDPRIPMRDF